jgi:anti-sigma factor RsiW
MSAPTTSCEEALRLLASYIDGELAGGERIDLERHLQTCRSCYSRAEFEKRLKTQLGELRRRPVNPAFEERIRRLIRRFEPAS